MIFAQGPLADAWFMHDGDVGAGWVVMTIGMIALWGAAIVLVIWLWRGRTPAGERRGKVPHELAPAKMLDRRLADGSLSVEDYERRRCLLEASDPRTIQARAPATVGADG